MIARLRRAALLVALAVALVSGAAPGMAAGPCDFSARLWPAGAKSIPEGETEALDRLIRECPDCTDIIVAFKAHLKLFHEKRRQLAELQRKFTAYENSLQKKEKIHAAIADAEARIAELDAEQEKLAVELTRCRHQCRQ